MKENQRIVITKHMLKDALLRLLKTKSIDKISVSELCAEASINRATFYRHYEIPQDILRDIETDFLEASHMFPIVLEEITSIQDIGNKFEEICIYIKDHSETAKILMKCNTAKDLANLLEGYCENFLIAAYGNLLDKDSLHLILSGLVGGGYSLLKTWLLEDIQKTPREMADLMVRFLSYGSKIF